MEYRKANKDDIPVLSKFRKSLLVEEGSPADIEIDAELDEYFRSGLSDGSFIAWLALDSENSKKNIAASGLCFYRLPPSFLNPTGKVAYITNVYTLPEYRKQGVASKLVQLLLDEAKTLGYTVVRLHASKDGRSIYEKVGFTDSEGYMVLKI